MKIIKIVSTFAIFLVLGGCAGHTTITEYYPVDRTDKSITVPAGGNEVFSLIKQGLIRDGWDLQIDDSSLLTTKSANVEQTFANYATKYRLVMTMYISTGGVGTFNVSVINNKNGKEVMTMFKPKAGGRESPEVVANRILDWFTGQVTVRDKLEPLRFLIDVIL